VPCAKLLIRGIPVVRVQFVYFRVFRGQDTDLMTRDYYRQVGIYLTALTAPVCLSLLAAYPGAAVPSTEAVVTEQKAQLIVRINHLFRGKPLRMEAAALETEAGDKVSISRLAYLISNIALIRRDGSKVRIANGPALFNPSENRNTVMIEGVPRGDFSGISFDVGLDPKTNHSDPSHYAPSHPLNPQVCKLHWSWKGGYVFLAVEGGYASKDGKRRGYSYHLGNDGNRTTVKAAGALRISGDAVATVDFDVAQLFNGISLSPLDGADSTHSAPNDPLAARLKANLSTAFRIETARPASELERASSSTPAPRVAVPGTAHPYSLPIPDSFPQTALPADNPLTVEGIALGKRLFFDPRLSGNGKQSCASCHRPDAAFSDSGRAHSLGIDGLRGTRRTMPLFNLAWSAPYTWDGRRERLRDQAIAPIVNEREMHASLYSVIARLAAESRYPAMFRSAFGPGSITSARLGLALEQYLLTVISADSKFDRAASGKAAFTDQEKRGLLLFVTEYDPARGRIGADCFHCHGGTLFSDYRFTNNGIDEHFADRGRALVTMQESDAGKFKTPSLRNIAITGPYMHDGRFKTLEEVIEHYTRGIHRTATLDPNIAKHPDAGMELSADDKAALAAFLRTLTDYKYLDHHSSRNPEPGTRN